MNVFKTLVPSDDGTIYALDTIEHEGGLWLVSMWCDARAEGLTKPARIIRMDALPHQKVQPGPGSPPADYVLNGPIPKAVLDGPASQGLGQQFVVVDLPDVEPMRLPDSKMH